VIRPERNADHPAIAEFVRAAFVGHPDEVATFVERVRASEWFIPELALVAEEFERASALGFISPHPKIPDEAFMVKRLPGYSPDLAGQIVYPAAFDALGY
jgi:predicted N-acetyltransferase YhbS